MRGKAEKFGKFLQCGRITPAYAGKSSTEDRLIVFYKDHPRLCGEKFKIPVVVGYKNRITPAYAGKSAAARWACEPCEDHPRLCGEKTKKIPKQRYFFHQPASFSFSLQYT